MLIEFVNIVKKLSNNCLNLYDQDHFMHLNLFRILQTDAFKKKGIHFKTCLPIYS